jgi:membrane protease YdiL (CAAX protease family)
MDIVTSFHEELYDVAPHETSPSGNRDPHGASRSLDSGRHDTITLLHHATITRGTHKGKPMIHLIKPWIKPVSYIALASFSCLLYSAFTPPLLGPAAASRLPLIGGLPGDLPGYWARFALSFLLLGVAPAVLALAFRERPADLGLNFKTPLLRMPLFWLLVPVAIAIGAIGTLSPDLGSFYPYSRDLIGRVRESGIGPFLGHFAAYFFLYYVPWEFFFRGFLLFPFALAAERAFAIGFADRDAAARATVLAALVLFQTIPSTLLHYGHPLTELAGAVAGGIIFGLLAWKTRSIVPGLILHAALGLGADGLIVLKGAGIF